MLAEDDKMLETFKEKVDFLGEFLVQDGQTEAARFMLILRGMLDHEVGNSETSCSKVPLSKWKPMFQIS
jgi:hypothetical protein